MMAYIEVCLRQVGEVDGTGSGLCPVAGFGISGIETQIILL